MKVKAEQLSQQLTTLAPIYIISGDEVLLCQEAADQVRKACLAQGVSERLRFVADAQFDWQDVINENQSLSLFSERRLFDIQIDKMSEKHSKALAQLGQSLTQDNIILLSLPKVDARTQKAKWFSQIESQGVFTQVWPIEGRRLPQWVQNRAQANQISLSSEAAGLICERGEGNLLALAQEIEKLALSFGTGTHIDVEQVMDAVSDSSRYSVYDLSDRILMGQAKHALHCLDQLLAEGIEANIILWLLNRETQTLTSLLAASEKMSFRQACQAQRIWDKRVPFYQSAMSRHNQVTLPYMQSYLALLDKSIKGLEGPDPLLGLRNLVMMFCGFKPVMTELDLPTEFH
ncbi:DNA polymerase III subunit delta [Marinomonas epiphytica]